MSAFEKMLGPLALLRPRNVARLSHRLEQLSGSVKDAARTADAVETKLAAAAERIQKQIDVDRQKAERDAGRLAKRDAEVAKRHNDAVAATRREIAGVLVQITSVAASLDALTAQLDKLSRRTEMLMTAYRSDAEHRGEVTAALDALASERTAEHIRRAIVNAEVREAPFPHAFVEQMLPDDVYDRLISALPPRVFFEDRPVNKQQMRVPFEFAPEYARAMWSRFSEVIVRVISPAVQQRFADYISAYLKQICPAIGSEHPPLDVSDGRIMLRRPGYVIAPHRDPKWGFVTVLMNLARHGDPEQYGTQLYRLRNDREAPIASPFWVDAAQCELAGEVPFRRNTTLIFLNSAGAHGASIPPDAPPELERYQFQCRIGPDADLIRRLMELMTPEGRALWTGKKTDKLGFAEAY